MEVVCCYWDFQWLALDDVLMAVNLGSIAIATAIISTSPVVASLLADKVLKEKRRRVQLFGMLISIGGTLMLI